MSYLIPIIALGGIYYMYNKQPTLEALDASDEPSFTLYHWTQCGHCRAMMPEWNSLGSKYNGVHIRKVEVSSNTEATDIDSYPTMIYRHAGMMEHYQGPRTREGMRRFLQAKAT